MRSSLYLHCLKRMLKSPPPFEVFSNTFSYLLNKRVFRRTVLRYTPMSVVIYLTKKCNYRCTFCYAANVLDNHDHASDLTLDQLAKLMDSPFGRRALRVGLLGGEPFLNKDIFQIIDEVKRRKKILTVVSNAALIDDQKIGLLLKTELDVLGISLYDNNRRHVERVVKGINGKLKYWVQTIISSKTISQMEPLIEFCLSIGCENLLFTNTIPVNDDDKELPIFSDNQEYVELQKKLKTKYRGQLKLGWVKLLPRGPARRDCSMPFSYVHADNLGNLGACCMRAPDGDLYGNIFTENDPWNRPYYRHLRKTMFDSNLPPVDICKGCHNLNADLYRL